MQIVVTLADGLLGACDSLPSWLRVANCRLHARLHEGTDYLVYASLMTAAMTSKGAVTVMKPHCMRADANVMVEGTLRGNNLQSS